MKKGLFLNRPNRFIAYIEIDGKVEVCHVKNTGRCKELLTERAIVYVEVCDNPTRKTKYDLIAVEKNGLLINMDSQAPNKAIGEWLQAGQLYMHPLILQAEKKDGNARIDFYLEDETRKAYIEVKGVTLEKDGVASFPDAPTERGIKHIHHLQGLMQKGFEAYLIFVVQFKPVLYMTPNEETHPAFKEALLQANVQGLHILALDCNVTKNSMEIADLVRVQL